jgi:hypothetical protein
LIRFLLSLLLLQGTAATGPTVRKGPIIATQGSSGSLPAFVQLCQASAGGTAQQNYTTTIASSGGTTGCTTNFAAGDMIAVGYAVNTGTDLTTSSISATGATITWRKAGSILQSGGGSFNGILYACPADITSPTSSIAVTVNMGSSLSFSGIYTVEISGIQNTTSCLDSGSVTNFTSASEAGTVMGPTATSSTLLSANEFIFVSGDASGSPGGITGSGACFGGTCTLPAQGTNGNLNSAAEYIVVSSTTAGNTSFTKSATASVKMLQAGFQH